MGGSVSKLGMRFFSALLTVLCNIPVLAADQLLSDPTRPSAYAAKMHNDNYTEKKISNYVVSQIYISSNTRMAIINSQTVMQGDRIGNAEIVAIKLDSVQLLVDGNIETIGIMPSIKQYNK